MTGPCIGIRIEDKSILERRAPLTPDDVRELRSLQGLEFAVQPSPYRFFNEQEYMEAGAQLRDDLSDCDLIVGIKEVPLERLIPGKPHLFFSHTIKGQSYNMAMLQKILDEKITLIDYEKVTNEQGQRLIAFSVQAGQAGMINSLWSLGQRLAVKGIDTPFAMLKQAKEYEGGLSEAKDEIRRVGERVRMYGLPEELTPLVVIITGGPGRVSRGASEVLDQLKPLPLTPEQLLDDEFRSHLSGNQIYKLVLDIPDFVRHRDADNIYDFQEYIEHPERYEPAFAQYLPHCSVLVNGIYWEERFPRLVSKQDVRQLFEAEEDPKLQVIGDVTCDPEGSVEVTLTPTLPDRPVYVYNPETEEIQYGFDGEGLLVMAVDILPSEIPEVSSIHFGSMLKPFLPELARADYSAAYEELALPDEFKRAVIAHRGELTPPFRYLEEALAKHRERA